MTSFSPSGTAVVAGGFPAGSIAAYTITCATFFWIDLDLFQILIV